MPTYAYRCRTCAHVFEALEKITASHRTRKCPACGGRAERIISGGAGFLFKGDGFYITDYRSEEYRSKAEKEKGADGPPAEAKADAKAQAEAGPAKEPAADTTAGRKPGKKRKKGGSAE